MDPQQRLSLDLAEETFQSAGLERSELIDAKIGVFIGACSFDWYSRGAGPFTGTGGSGSIISNRVSYVYGLQGPSQTIDTACSSSSLVAIDNALSKIHDGSVQGALVGGVVTSRRTSTSRRTTSSCSASPGCSPPTPSATPSIGNIKPHLILNLILNPHLPHHDTQLPWQ